MHDQPKLSRFRVSVEVLGLILSVGPTVLLACIAPGVSVVLFRSVAPGIGLSREPEHIVIGAAFFAFIVFPLFIMSLSVVAPLWLWIFDGKVSEQTLARFVGGPVSLQSQREHLSRWRGRVRRITRDEVGR
jgi:ABC-type sugar transport system permease subunit